MTILRKACRSCTASKRRCVVQLPKCARCTQRGLECMYDLEPLKSPAVHSREMPKLSWGSVPWESPGYCLIKSVENQPSLGDPAICQPGHQNALEVLRFGYLPVLGLLKSGSPAIFAHPKLHMQGCYNHLDMLRRHGPSNDSFRSLVELDTDSLPIMESITALQALLVHLSAFTLDRRQHTEEPFNLLTKWTHSLLTSAQNRMPSGQSPWQTWLFGETVRRTLIMSYILAMTISSFMHGYCAYWLIIESLPLDRRPGLWMAESPQAWISAAGARSGEDVGEQLVSVHEYAVSLKMPHHGFRDDRFLALLAHSHNGDGPDCAYLPSGN